MRVHHSSVPVNSYFLLFQYTVHRLLQFISKYPDDNALYRFAPRLFDYRFEEIYSAERRYFVWHFARAMFH